MTSRVAGGNLARSNILRSIPIAASMLAILSMGLKAVAADKYFLTIGNLTQCYGGVRSRSPALPWLRGMTFVSSPLVSNDLRCRSVLALSGQGLRPITRSSDTIAAIGAA